MTIQNFDGHSVLVIFNYPPQQKITGFELVLRDDVKMNVEAAVETLKEALRRKNSNESAVLTVEELKQDVALFLEGSLNAK